MPLVYTSGKRAGRIRTDPSGSIRPGKDFNNFPAIAAAFPEVLSAIVVLTTDELAVAAAGRAPVQGQARGRAYGSWNGRPDVAPGTLRRSAKIRFAKRRGTDLVVTGRVDFKATDPTSKEPNHSFAKAVEFGSVRTLKSIGKGPHTLASGIVTSHYAIPPEPFLVPSIKEERPRFIARLQGLEALLPR